MHLKKLLIALSLIGSSIGYCEEKRDAEASPPPSEQTAPAPESQPPNVEPLPPEPSEEEVPAPLPSSKEMTNSYENAFVRMLVTLLGLVVLVFATFWILRRLGKGKFKMGSGNTINVLERRTLSPKSILYIVQIGNKKVLISESQLEVRALTSLEELPETNG